MANQLPDYKRPGPPGKSLLVFVGDGVDHKMVKLALAAWNKAAGSPLFKLTEDRSKANVLLRHDLAAGKNEQQGYTNVRQNKITIDLSHDAEYHLIAHELGHALGLGHPDDPTVASTSTNQPRVMGEGLGVWSDKQPKPKALAPIASGEARLAAEMSGFPKPSAAKQASRVGEQAIRERS